MASIHRSARVAYAAAQMFDLVSDVEAYPEFLHWCRAARVDRRGEDYVEATLSIGVRGIRKSFTTRNTFERPRRLVIELVSGPFRRLNGVWEFTDLEEGGSEVSLSLTFEVMPSPLSVVFSMVFEELARAQMAAFVQRAERVYGGK